MYQFQHINSENIFLVKDFLSELGNGNESFRYFAKRPVEVVLKHLLAVVLIDDQKVPVAYGHLDKEGSTLWLGVAVAEKAQGIGLGKKMLTYLIDYARSQGEAEITLTVDKTNHKAIKLYEANDFIQVDELEYYYKYTHQLK